MPRFVIEFYVRLYFEGRRLAHLNLEWVLEAFPV